MACTRCNRSNHRIYKGAREPPLTTPIGIESKKNIYLLPDPSILCGYSGYCGYMIWNQ
jgi:hypothetical protein